MQKKRRIFIGYTLSDELKDTFIKWRKDFDNLPVRWMPPENLHITLVPPWYEKDVASVIKLLQNAENSVTPFTISLESITFGPDVRRPRLIWAKGNTPEAFIKLKLHLTTVLQKDPEKRSPLLHVTLARFRHEQFLSFANRTIAEKIAWGEKVTTFSVIESHLRRTGAVYETLAEIPLQ